MLLLCAASLIGAVLAAVHHAEVVAHRLGEPLGTLVLGLQLKEIAMLAMTFVVSAITLGSGRTHLMQGAVHLVVFAAFLFLALVP